MDCTDPTPAGRQNPATVVTNPVTKPRRCPESRFSPSRTAGLAWLAAEPFRVFFVSGALWSIVGVLLWPLFYAGILGFYPNVAHARIMIEAFGGAFVVGFLGTAGPRVADAPELAPAEFAWLVVLHLSCGIAHLAGAPRAGDAVFVVLIGFLLVMLLVRVLFFRGGAPPPQLVLALAGLLCGAAGAAMFAAAGPVPGTPAARLAGLLLYQGLLLLPLLGIGSFIFPRVLGDGFGEPATPTGVRAALVRSVAAAALVVASFGTEAAGHVTAGCALRAFAAAGYLAVEVRWRKAPGAGPRGSLATGLSWALGTGLLGIALVPLKPVQHASVAHLLYIGGFGLVMLVIASRVLFGHSGDLGGFARRSRWVRFLVSLAVLAAATRATPAWVPATTVSHHIYAAVTWAVLAACWLAWHRRRFAQREPGGEGDGN